MNGNGIIIGTKKKWDYNEKYLRMAGRLQGNKKSALFSNIAVHFLFERLTREKLARTYIYTAAYTWTYTSRKKHTKKENIFRKFTGFRVLPFSCDKAHHAHPEQEGMRNPIQNQEHLSLLVLVYRGKAAITYTLLKLDHNVRFGRFTGTQWNLWTRQRQLAGQKRADASGHQPSRRICSFPSTWLTCHKQHNCEWHLYLYTVFLLQNRLAFLNI